MQLNKTKHMQHNKHNTLQYNETHYNTTNYNATMQQCNKIHNKTQYSKS